MIALFVCWTGYKSYFDGDIRGMLSIINLHLFLWLSSQFAIMAKQLYRKDILAWKTSHAGLYGNGQNDG